jgi:hypothetical protein
MPTEICRVCSKPILRNLRDYAGHPVHMSCHRKLLRQNINDPTTLRRILQRNR